jgi:hypothetical protein
MPPDSHRTTLARNQDRFRRPLVKENDCPGPERLSSTGASKKNAFALLLVWRRPATGLAVWPPTIRLPTLFHSFRRSRAEELDPLA